MPVCTRCGRDVPKKTSVYKMMKTGKYADGGNFYREVSLCPRCAAIQEQEDAEKKKQKSKLLLVVAVVAVGALAYFAYWYFIKQQQQEAFRQNQIHYAERRGVDDFPSRPEQPPLALGAAARFDYLLPARLA